MDMRLMGVASILLLVTSLAAGCTRNSVPTSASTTNAGAGKTDPQTPEAAIRAAIQAHLAHKGTLNVQAFQTDVKQLAIEGDRAEAQVEFRVKDGPGSMQLTYALEKRDNAWSVVESLPVGSNFSHPPLDEGQALNAPGTPAPAGPMSDPVRFFKNTVPQPATRR
jgi:hypothetical protein